jgi:hypothetical protein
MIVIVTVETIEASCLWETSSPRRALMLKTEVLGAHQ